jgi:hypothetical protein
VKNFFSRAKRLVSAYKEAQETDDLSSRHVLGKIVNEGNELGGIYEKNKGGIENYANKPKKHKYAVGGIIAGLINYMGTGIALISTISANEINMAANVFRQTMFYVMLGGTIGFIALGVLAGMVAKIIRDRRQAVLEEGKKIIKMADEFSANLNKN